MPEVAQISEQDPSLRAVVALHYGYSVAVAVVFVLWLGYLARILPEVIALSSGDNAEELTWIAFAPLVFVVAAFAAIFAGHMVLLLAVARFVRLRRQYGACVVGDAVLCLSFPVGTVIGIYLLVALSKARSQFGRAPLQ